MGKTTEPKPNDQRSTVKNPNSKEYEQDRANTGKQVRENQPKKGK